jgi:hypothetical protein
MDENEHPKGALVFMLIYLVTLAALRSTPWCSPSSPTASPGPARRVTGDRSAPSPSTRAEKNRRRGGITMKRILASTGLIAILLVATTPAGAQQHPPGPQTPPPAPGGSMGGMMGGMQGGGMTRGTEMRHQWMLGYEYTFEDMDGNRSGTRRLSRGKVLDRFPTVPTDGSMEMHMATLMYAPSNDLSFMAMMPYVRKAMTHITAAGVRFREFSEGPGDLQLRGLYSFYNVRGYEHRFLLNAAISVPTGTIDARDFGPDRSMGRDRLEYPMQLGSGTVDVLPGLTYLGQTGNWAWGVDAIPTLRLGRNRHNYRLGNRYEVDGWAARKLTDWLSLSGRVDGRYWENIEGADRTLNRMDEPTKDPNKQGGERLDLLFGLNLYAPSGLLKGQRVAVEAGAPVYQSLRGPQLQTDWLVRVGWQWVF